MPRHRVRELQRPHVRQEHREGPGDSSGSARLARAWCVTGPSLTCTNLEKPEIRETVSGRAVPGTSRTSAIRTTEAQRAGSAGIIIAS